MFDKLVKDNQSIMSAYAEVMAKKNQEALTESENSGGDTSAYNKYLLGKLGDLPRTEAGYKAGKMEEKQEMEEGLLGAVKRVGQKVLDTMGHGSDEDLIKDLQKKAGVPETGKKPEGLKEDEDHEDEEEDKELIRDMVKKTALKEYHVAGTVNGKPFKMITDDVYNYSDAKQQNPHLSDDEAKAIVDHTETDDFESGDESTKSIQNGHVVKTHTNGGYAGEREEVRNKLGLTEDTTDTVCMDVPFLIRVMEFAKEDAKTDQDLHFAAEKMIAASKNGTLTMSAYDEVFGKPHAGPDGDNDADDKQSMAEGGSATFNTNMPDMTSEEMHEDKEHLDEVLTASTPVETWIADFVDSKNPKFDGKSKEERRKMAIGAYYAAQKK